VARDPEEQVTALYALAVLAHRAGQPEAALAAVEQALDVMPNSPILWRMRVAMAGGEPDVVNRARSHCPEDSELWLAGLVSAVQHSNRAVQAEADVRAAAAESRYSPGTFVRAGDYLLRHGRLEAAQAAARQALRGGRGLLAAQVLGLRVALASRDSRAALACARAAAGQAADPGPFLAIAVQLMMARDPDGPAAIPDLETLVALYPADPQWRLRLGHLRFRTGDIEGARTAFAPLTAALPAGLEPGLLTVMAETARLTGDRPASLRVLRESLGRHPASATLLNNLVYTLAQAPDGVAEAASLLPRLLAGTPSPAAWDTAGEVCWKAGEREQAQAHARRALATVKASDPAWAAIHLNAAEMQCALGNVRETEALLKETLGRPQDLGIAERQRIDALESRLARLKR
jgi:tetratricopeptide (TPR) repeat protein